MDQVRPHVTQRRRTDDRALLDWPTLPLQNDASTLPAASVIGTCCRLIKLWLKVPVEESDDDGKRRLTGGKGGSCDTPQSGVISPLLANLYMNRFLKHWRATGRCEA
jgi:RNA-directed DNA polymerase